MTHTDYRERTAPDEDDRHLALRVASRLMTGREDPHIVLPVADRLLTWLSDAALPGSVEQRSRAMDRQALNISTGPGRQGVTAFADDPDAFLAAAAAYVPFIAGGAA